MKLLKKLFIKVMYGIDTDDSPIPVNTQIDNHPGKPAKEDLDLSSPMGKCHCGGTKYLLKGSLTEVVCSQCGLVSLLVLAPLPEYDKEVSVPDVPSGQETV